MISPYLENLSLSIRFCDLLRRLPCIANDKDLCRKIKSLKKDLIEILINESYS